MHADRIAKSIRDDGTRCLGNDFRRLRYCRAAVIHSHIHHHTTKTEQLRKTHNPRLYYPMPTSYEAENVTISKERLCVFLPMLGEFSDGSPILQTLDLHLPTIRETD
jgi:hypothetical protein